jgi:hypothetical protein
MLRFVVTLLLFGLLSIVGGAAAAPWVLSAGCTENKSDMGDTQAAKGTCGTRDEVGRWSGVAWLCENFDKASGDAPPTFITKAEPAGLCTGCTTTFIEDDIIAAEAHCLGFEPDTPACCDAPGAHGASVCDFTTTSPSPARPPRANAGSRRTS